VKKVLALIMCLAISFAIVGCGGGAEKAETESKATDTPAPSVSATKGSIEVEILSCEIVKDTEGKDSVLIKYHFKNGTEKKQNFKFATKQIIKQGDKTLSTAVVAASDKCDSSLVTKSLLNGEETDVVLAFAVIDTQTPIDVECIRLSGEDKTSITKQLPLK